MQTVHVLSVIIKLFIDKMISTMNKLCVLPLFFQNYSKKFVMHRALPVAVRFLHAGNKDLSRNVSSYLSLAAIENVELLSQHLQPVIDSIIAGNINK